MQTGLKKVYTGASPEFLLLAGWVFLSAAMGLRICRALQIPPLNLLFVFIGLAAYFLPTRLGEREKGDALRRKLLWLIVLAGLLILGGEIARLLSTGGRI